jgi:hypothetical protein
LRIVIAKIFSEIEPQIMALKSAKFTVVYDREVANGLKPTFKMDAFYKQYVYNIIC